MRTRVQLVIACAMLAYGGGVVAEDLGIATFRDYVDAQGRISLPQDFRLHWSHLGSWVVADTAAPGHGFHDVYTQAPAVEAYRQTGKFPDGTVLVKEIRKIDTAAMTTGQAQWAAQPAVWFVMVKNDKGRFSHNTHWDKGWGWALFEAKAPALDIAKSFAETCQGCHTPAQHTDWVFVQGYPTLRDTAQAVTGGMPR
ncbi:MAG: cytochrome P460 family protein [Gammaproteobacteria bacterium]|nr:cytochrome P460 family protein [Gammaproteobacteria bacterium]